MFSYYISHPVFPCKEAHNPQQTLVIGQWFTTSSCFLLFRSKSCFIARLALNRTSNSLCSTSPVLPLQGGPLRLAMSYSNRSIIFSLGIWALRNRCCCVEPRLSWASLDTCSPAYVSQKHTPGASQVLWLKMIERQERSGQERQNKNVSDG